MSTNRTIYDCHDYTELFADSVRVDDHGSWTRLCFVVTVLEDIGNGIDFRRVRRVIGTVVIPSEARARLGRQLSSTADKDPRVMQAQTERSGRLAS